MKTDFPVATWTPKTSEGSEIKNNFYNRGLNNWKKFVLYGQNKLRIPTNNKVVNLLIGIFK